MPAKINMLPSANSDVDYLVSQMSDYSPRAAQKFYNSVFQTIEWLSRVPFGGAILDAILEQFPSMRYARVKRFKNYIVFYEASESEIVIHHVVDGRRDYIADIFDL